MTIEVREKNETLKNGSSFLTSFVKTYSTVPLHEITAIHGKISGALMVADAIEDAVQIRYQQSGLMMK